MHTQQWLLFGHLIGVVMLFGAIALGVTSLVGVVRAGTIEQVRAATYFEPVLPRLFPASVVVILVFGFWMVGDSDEFKFGQAWIDLSLGLVIVLSVVGATVQGRRMAAIREAAADASGPLTADLAARINDPVLRTATLVSVALAVDILFLMSRQPGWVGAWVSVAVAAVAGVVAAGLLTRFSPTASAGPPSRTAR